MLHPPGKIVNDFVFSKMAFSICFGRFVIAVKSKAGTWLPKKEEFLKK